MKTHTNNIVLRHRSILAWLRLVAALTLCGLLPSLQAQTEEGATKVEPGAYIGVNRVFILDGSGSMWSRVSGRPKIAIAKEVMNGLVDGLPARDQVGLIVYGHRRKGDCSDVELIYPLGPVDKDLLRKRINRINPKGKTPITDAVNQAVDIVRKLEGEAEANIILVSDGLETCGSDPCEAVRRAREAGVPFHMYVVGFGLKQGETEQLRCMADAGGGRYFGAEDADQLATAMQQVVAAQPEPEQIGEASVEVPESAVIGAGFEVSWTGPNAKHDYLTIVPAGAEPGSHGNYTYTIKGNPASLRAPDESGDYLVRYIYARGKRTLAEAPITIVDAAVELDAPEQVGIGAEFVVSWTGPANQNDYICIAEPDADARGYDNYRYARKDTPLRLRASVRPGAYELRYVTGQTRRILVRRPIEVVDVGASLTAPEQVSAGAGFEVEWQGPANYGDFITIVPADAPAGTIGNYRTAQQGNPALLTAQDEAGNYEIRYLTRGRQRILARTTIEIVATFASLDAPQTVPAGSEFQVAWRGPANNRDFIAIAETNSPPRTYKHYTKARGSKPLTLRAPDTPGNYELRYITGQSKEVLVRRRIEVGAVTASVSAPTRAMAGSRVSVDWTGPDNKSDFITIVPAGAVDDKYGRSDRTKKGNPIVIQTPEAPGAYEIRYLTGASHKLLARQAIELSAAKATLTAPETVQIGETIEIVWDGPAGQGDRIVLVREGEQRNLGSKAAQYPGTLFLRGRKEPGNYEIRYLTGHERRILARETIRIEE